MKRVILTLAVVAALGVAGGAAVIAVGLYNVSAQAGHLPGISWVLHTTFGNSVRLRAPSMEEAPPLDDPDLIALGAAHFATACASCHGRPGETRSATVRAMVPVPPPIAEAVTRWRPNEMHWIVENGVKMSGMPAWPAEGRGDEVWAVVAYLTAVKKHEAPPVPDATDPATAYCASCHGKVGGRVPRLDIQKPEYLTAQLEAYLSGERPSGIMGQAASRVPRESFAALGRHFGAKGAQPPPANVADDEGARLARQGSRDVPACLACHGADDGQRKGPALYGQSEEYLVRQLRLWRDGVYHHNALMQAAARELSDGEIALLSRHFSGADD